MPIRMFKALYQNTKITDLNPNTKITHLNKSIEKIKLHTYNNSCIPPMGVCNVTTVNKGIEYQCSLFVVPGNTPALLGMSDC